MYTTLVKLFLKENISLKRLMGFDVKKSKAKAILIGLAILYSIAAFIGVFGYMFFDLGKILHGLGQDAILISFICVYSLGMAFVITFFRASGTLFYYKDYEILAPLPIHPRMILAAKMTVMMIMLYLMSFIVVLPILFSYFYWYGFNLLSSLYFIIGFLFIPLIPVTVVSFLSLGIATLTARMRHAKILNIILVFVLMIGLFMVMFSVNDIEQNPLTGQIDLFSGIARVYLPFDWFRLAVHEQSLISLVYVVLSNGLIFGLYLYVIQGLVQKTNQKGIRVTMRKDGGPIKYQKRSIVWALVNKEIKRFLNSITYATNAGFGPVILLVASIASLFFKTQLEDILAQAIGVGLPLEVMILTLIGFTLAMTYTPAISLSLEGKNFWIVKSLPLKPKTIMYSKILFNLILAIPVGLLSVIMFGISLSLPLLNQVIMMVLVVVFACVISAFDAMVNLLIPKFNFVNDVEVIKQSAGALIAIFGGFAIMAINGVVFHFFSDWMNASLVFLSMIGANVILLIPLIFFLEKKTDKIFSKFQG
jgi:ABC-2 type transport system permease protein